LSGQALKKEVMQSELINEHRAFVSTELAGNREFRFALAAVLVSFVIFVAAAPFAKMPLAQVPAFIPAYESALVICDVITAVLLFGQFSFLRWRALLVLASGYLFTALTTVSHALSFPGVFSPTGLLGAGPQSTAWLYVFWHAGFPLVVIAYALLKNEASDTGGTRGNSGGPRGHARGPILTGVVLVLAIVCVLTFSTSAGHEFLPAILQGGRITDLGHTILSSVWVLSLLALAPLWRRRPHTVLDLWLMVVMCAWLFDSALSVVLGEGRYDLGFYVGRIYGLLAASFLLIVLLIENSKHYVRLVRVEAKYRGLLEAAPDAMVVVNQGGEIVLLNVQTEKQFGYRRDELIGQKVKNIIPQGFTERLLADSLRSVDDLRAQQMGSGIELTGRRNEGSEFPIEIMLSPMESVEGILVTAAIRDITERKRTEAHLAKTMAELKSSNDELQQFVYVASHDLQEPLRMVASYTQLLARRYKGRLDADADEFIAHAVDGANRMQRLIRDLLAYSLAGPNEKTVHEISSEGALQGALANLRASIEESGAVVTHDALPAITTDGTQLAQVFQNLVGNAIKYRSAEVPQVHVSAQKNGGNEWIFSVRDNGLGIDPQYFERIFVIFQRLHARDEYEGTGLGLAICKKMLARLGGRIWIESQLQKGSTFYFALPEGGAR
jgi:PAS domain S-box-containing protein